MKKCFVLIEFFVKLKYKLIK